MGIRPQNALLLDEIPNPKRSRYTCREYWQKRYTNEPKHGLGASNPQYSI
jgi:hypothetical protein